MKDLIDEKNKQEKMKNSIIKYWNVHYIDEETLKRQAEEERLRKAQEIIDRLAAEETADEAEKRKEQERAYHEAQRQADMDLFNHTTGAFSGKYGEGQIDEVSQGQIEKILQEKDAELRKIIKDGNN